MTIYTKTCVKCKITKSIADFSKCKSAKDGLQTSCKGCCKQYREANKDKANEYSRQYHQANRDQINENKKQYYLDNIEEKREYNKKYRQSSKDKLNEYQRVRRATDPLFALSGRLRTRIGTPLRKNGYTKNSTTAQILGCSFEEFKKHIESLFTDGMSWENRDEWHLDHIKPVSLGSTEQEIIALNHYKNFQPLWALDNIRKSNNYSK